MLSRLSWTIALHLALFPALFVAWAVVAGQSGSPAPDNWPVLERVLYILGVSAKVSIFLFLVVPLAWYAASKGSRWTLAYPILLLLDCGTTILFSLNELAHAPPQPVFVVSSHGRCWRFGKNIPMLDAVGKQIRNGDLLIIRSTSTSDDPLPDTSEQAAERKVWDGHIVVAAGTMPGGALRVEPTGQDVRREAPGFCVWPDSVVHVRTH